MRVLDLGAESALLQSADAAGLLRAALTGGADAPLPEFSAELTNWQYRPGAEVTAGYRVGYLDPAGEQVVEHLFVTSDEPGGDAVRVSRDGLAFSVWRHPQDPRLPGLAAACDPAAVLRWVRDVGVPRPEALDITLLGYRPLRRAVLRATARTGDAAEEWYLKVLRPDRTHRLVRRQELLASAGLTPGLAAEPSPGVLLTPAAAGIPLATVLAAPAGDALPSPADLVALLDRLPVGVVDLERRPAWSERLDFHAATAVEALPGQVGRIRSLVRRLEVILAGAPVGPVRPTHGDFYEANIMVGQAGRLSLVDLDAVGPGLREDDLGCLLAHLAVLPALSPDHYRGVPEVLRDWTSAFEREVDPAALAARVAGVALSLVSGAPGDRAAQRLTIVEDWTRRAVAEETVTRKA